MKSIFAALSICALLPLSAGCADEGDKESCIGLKCPTGFQWPDGGENRVWYIALPDGSSFRRLISYYLEEASDETGNEILPEPGVGLCDTDLTAFQLPNRKYIDAGESVTYKMGPTDEAVVDRLLASEEDGPVVDFYGREHDIAYVTQLTSDPADDFYQSYQSVETADTTPFSDMMTGLYMPPKLNATANDMPQQFWVFKKGEPEDIVMKWEEVEPPDPDVVTGAAIVFAPDDHHAETIACIVGNNGEFVVPAATIERLEAQDETGIFVIGTATNNAILTDEGRMIQQWGINCVLFPYQFVD